MFRYDLSTVHGFEAAFSEHRRLAFSVAHSVLGNAAAAEDVVQDVFAHLWRRPRSFDPKRGSLRSYIALLARSRALDRVRTRTARRAAIERSAGEARATVVFERDAHEHAEEHESRKELARACRELPEDQRDAILLAFGRGLSAREVASATDVPLGTAKSRIRLGLMKAREVLEAAA